MNEIRNTVKSRSSLRNKHLVQLEEKKTSLEELKTKVQHQFLPSTSIEIDKLITLIDNDQLDDIKNESVSNTQGK